MVTGATRVSPGFWAGRRVLLTGHTGFKGAWLALWLHRLGARVTGLSLPPEGQTPLFDAAGVMALLDHRVVDLRDAGAVAAQVREARPEIVLHLAAQALVRRSYAEPLATFATNVMGTAHLLEALRGVSSVRAVVVVTSDKCYENREWVWGYREGEPLGGHDPYSASKAATEMVAQAWSRAFLAEAGIGLASARAGNVIGGGDWAEDRLLPDLVRAFRRGEAAPIRRPDAVRPWQHVLEPLAGYLQLAQRLVDDAGTAAGAWNFGPADDDARPVREVADLAAHAWGPEAGWAVVGDPGPHEAHWLKLDASKARQHLGWRPRLSLDEAVAWTVGWYRRFVEAPAQARPLALAQIERYEELLAHA